MSEIQHYTPEEVLTQILVNQALLLRTAIRFVTPHCADKNNEDWIKINHILVDEYHRTREMTGEETIGEFWKAERGEWDK